MPKITWLRLLVIIALLTLNAGNSLFGQSRDQTNLHHILDSRFLDWGGSTGFPGWAHAVIEDKEGLIWMSTSEGLVRFDGVSFLLTATTPKNYGEFRRLFIIDDQIYLGDHDKPLHKYTQGSASDVIEEVTWPYSRTTELNIWSSYTHNDGRILLADHNGIIYEYNRQKEDVGVFFEMPSELNGISGLTHTARQIQADPFDQDKIWVCSKQGLFHINMKDGGYEFYRPTANSGLSKLSSDNSYALHDHIQIGSDHWISSYGNGLVKFNTIDKSWESFRYEPPYQTIREDANFILSHHQYGDNYIFIGGRDLKLFDVTQKMFFDFKRHHGGYNASSVPTVWMYTDRQGSLYMITGGILSKYSNQHNQFLIGDLKNVLLNEPSNSIVASKRLNDKSFLLLDDKEQAYEWNTELLSLRLLANYKDDLLNNTGIYQPSYSWYIKQDTLALQKSASDKSIDLILNENDLSNIRSVNVDQDQNAWLCSVNGLIKYDIKEHRYVAYGQRHGLPSSDWTKDGFIRTLSDGSMFATSGTSFAYFDPVSFKDLDVSIKPYVYEIEVYNDSKFVSHKVGQPIEFSLEPDEDYFSLHFSGLEQSHTGDLEFQYRLVGYDGLWINGRQDNIASYTNVHPGSYKFEMRAKRQGGQWAMSQQEVTININATFLETLWFRLLLFAGIGGLIYIAYRYRVKNIREEEKLRSSFQQELGEMKLEALRSQMNPHFLFNSLNSIDHYILNNKPQEASEYLSKFSKLVRKILEFSKRKSVSINEELETLKNYVQMEQMRFSKKFLYTVQVNDNVDINAIQIPPLLLQPYVENAIWHGLMHLENKIGTLEITIEQKEDHITVSIDDNGIGRVKSKEIKSKTATKRKSYGIKINEDRIRLNNELSNLGGHIEIIDIYDEKKKPIGTKVLLSLPKENYKF